MASKKTFTHTASGPAKTPTMTNAGARTAAENRSRSSLATPPTDLDPEKVAQRAKAIWQNKGCPRGRDEENWLEAEAQLKQETGAGSGCS